MGLQNEKEFMKGIKSASGWLRREVGRAVQLRYAPELVLVLDESIVRGAHINEMVNRLEREGKMGSDETDEVEEDEE